MEKNCVIFVIKKLYFVNFFDFIWTWTFNFKTFRLLDCGWTWTEFWKFRTGSGSQNMTVRSSLLGTRLPGWHFKAKFQKFGLLKLFGMKKLCLACTSWFGMFSACFDGVGNGMKKRCLAFYKTSGSVRCCCKLGILAVFLRSEVLFFLPRSRPPR